MMKEDRDSALELRTTHRHLTRTLLRGSANSHITLDGTTFKDDFLLIIDESHKTGITALEGTCMQSGPRAVSMDTGSIMAFSLPSA